MINITQILKHNVIGKLLNHLLVFLINVIIVRILGASGSGIYFNELYILNFAAFIFSAGLDYAAIDVLSKNASLLPLIRKILTGVVALFAFVLIVLLLLAPGIRNHFSQPWVSMLLFSVGNLMLILFQGILSALKKFNLQNVILGVCNFIFLLYLFFCWRTGLSLSLYHVAVAYALLLFIQGILMLVFCTREPSPEKPDQSFDKLLFLRSGWFIMISSLVYFAFLRVDNFFVERYCDPVTLGNYVQCGKIGQYFLYFSSIISSTLLPFIATETVGASYNEWKDMMKPYITLICLAAFLLALSGSYLFPMFFGEEFNRMHIYMLILLPGFVCLGILTLLNSVYIGKGNVKMIFIGDVLGLISVLLFDWLFVGRYGAVAAAVISSVSYCMVFLFLWRSFKKQFDLPARSGAAKSS